MKMDSRIAADLLASEFRVVDIRELDGESLLESESLDENIVSVLARLPDQRRAVRRILQRIAESGPERRANAVRKLAILAALRSLGSFVVEESRRMPILTDIMEHDYLGPLIRESLATGRVEGRAEGRLAGERTLILGLISKRFGAVPDWAKNQVESLGTEEVEDLGPRVLDAKSLEELFGAA